MMNCFCSIRKYIFLQLFLMPNFISFFFFFFQILFLSSLDYAKFFLVMFPHPLTIFQNEKLYCVLFLKLCLNHKENKHFSLILSLDTQFPFLETTSITCLLSVVPKLSVYRSKHVCK